MIDDDDDDLVVVVGVGVIIDYLNKSFFKNLQEMFGVINESSKERERRQFFMV